MKSSKDNKYPFFKRLFGKKKPEPAICVYAGPEYFRKDPPEVVFVNDGEEEMTGKVYAGPQPPDTEGIDLPEPGDTKGKEEEDEDLSAFEDVYAGPEFFERLHDGPEEPEEPEPGPEPEPEPEPEPVPGPEFFFEPEAPVYAGPEFYGAEEPVPPVQAPEDPEMMKGVYAGPEKMNDPRLFMMVYAGPDYFNHMNSGAKGMYAPPPEEVIKPEIPEGKGFCQCCGNRLLEGQKFCPECGAVIPPKEDGLEGSN